MPRFPSVMNKRILILVALVTMVFTGKALFDITGDRKQVIASAERLSRGFATTFNEHAIRTFSDAENSLDSLVRDIGAFPGRVMPDERRLHRLLARYRGASTSGAILFVADAGGTLYASSSEYPTRRLALSDREYFQHHRQSPKRELFISRPLGNRLTGSPLIFLTKRLDNPDGSLRMVVGISIDPAYFRGFYRTVELGGNDRVFLFRRDGAILAMEPQQGRLLDRLFPPSEVLREKLSRLPHAGTFRLERGLADDTSRIVSYRFSGPYPIVSVVSLREDDVLARWRTRSLKSAGGALLLVLLVGTLGLLVYRQIRELKQSEDKYSLIATTANEGIWMLDECERITYVNPRVADLFGYPAEEMIGRRIGDFMCADELEDHEARMRFRKQGGAERYERRFRHRDGSVVWTVISAAALIDEDEGYQGVVAMCVDVSDRKRGEQRQARLEQELRQAHKMEAVGIMAGGMAHDFNNLLQSLMSYLFLARMSTEGESEAHEYLDEAERISGQACELGQRLMLLSRGGVTMLRSAPLPPLILAQVCGALKGTPVAFEFELPPDMPPVTMDEALIRQVVTHLTTNAIETMSQGGRLRIWGATVVVSSRQELPLPSGEYVHVAFSDTGAGIPAEHLPKIFDPYFSTKQKRTGKGIGLGLALCHTIIRKHRGLINASSRVGQGTTINIYLPVAAGDDSPRQSQPV